MESPAAIGKFRVLEPLGQGAMGRVYLAEDPLIDRKVAIKVMHVEGDDEARERFRNEARSAGQLSHPNIVQLHEFGFHDGQPYLVMEYLLGESLDSWLTRPQPLEAKLSILVDLCAAIAHAHSRGVLHRDVKPSNLQVLPDGVCKLVDFGIARTRSVKLTATGMILGTPDFIAPEILRSAGYSTRSDLYAVGLVAYQVLGGANPFHASTLEACLARVMTYDPPALAEARPGIPQELSEAVAKYLCKSPEERPADVGPLMAVLRRSRDRTRQLETNPQSASWSETATILELPADPDAPTQVQPGPAPAPGRRRLWAVAALVAAFAVAGVLASWTPWWPWAKPVPVSTATPPIPASASPATAAAPANAPETDSGADVESTAADRRQADAEPRSPSAEPEKAKAGWLPDREAAAADRETAPTGSSEKALAIAAAAGSSSAPVQSPPPPASPAPEAPPDPALTAPPEATAAGEPTPDRSTEPAAEAAAEEPQSAGPTLPAEAMTEPPADRPPPAAEPPSPAPRIDRLRPMVVRRGSTASLRITGDGFGPETRVVIRRGNRTAEALRILRSQLEGTSELRVTVRVDLHLPLGTYTLAVVDAEGRESNAVGLEVGL